MRRPQARPSSPRWIAGPPAAELCEYYCEGDTRSPTWIVAGDASRVAELTGLGDAAVRHTAQTRTREAANQRFIAARQQATQRQRSRSRGRDRGYGIEL